VVLPDQDVAIVHDYLNQRGGAERVVLEMTRMWPKSPVYTSLYRPESTFPEFTSHEVRTSVLDRMPVDRRFRALLPAYPLAFRSLGVLGTPLVISSSSGWAHSVRTAPGTTHVVYCYAPARWLYETDRYVPSRARRAALGPLLGSLRRWDREAAGRADAYIAISANVRDRIRTAYGIEAEIVYPPVDTRSFRVGPRGGRLLVVSRLLRYKRIDLVVEAASRLGMGLDVVGTGPMLSQLQSAAGPKTSFHGTVDDETLRELIERRTSGASNSI